MQKKAKDFGWSKTLDSDHLGGGAGDLWPVDEKGQIVFDRGRQAKIVDAMKQAAQEMGVDLEAGADWKSPDRPHFGMVGQTPMNGPIPTARPGGTDPIATGSVRAGDSFLQAKPNRMTPAMGFEVNPAGAPLPDPGFDANPAGAPLPDPGFEPVNTRNVPVNDAGLRTPAGADFLSRMGSPAPMAQQQLPMVPPVPQRRMVNPASMSGGPQPLPMVPGRSGGPMPSLQQPVPPPQPPQPAPVPPPAPAPAPPAPPPQVDPFTDMILGDKAAQFKPGNYIPPAPVGKQVFPAAPPAPGTPAAAGFGVPQQAMAGGGGSNAQAGGAGGDFPPAPPAPGQRGGGPQNVIGKLMTILASPYASDEQKRMATAMLSREYALEDERRKAASPEAQLDLQYKQAMIDNARNKNVAKPMTAEERKFWGIPDSDTRPYMMTEAGPSLIGGAGQTINVGATPATRAADITAAGGDPTDPKWQTYIATGQGTPGKAGGVMPSDRRDMRKAEDELPGLTSTIGALKQARDLNKTAYEGFGAGLAGKIGTEFEGWIPDRMQDPKTAQATEQMMQILSQGAVEQMAATLAGATTEGELKRFVDILANPNTSRSLREQTITRMINLAEQQAALRKDRIAEIREQGGMDPPKDSGAGGADEGGWTVMPNGTKVRKKGP
jgi:hypothetical protein